MSEQLNSVIELDLLGDRCPIPVQRIRRTIREHQTPTTLIAIGDDPESLHDIPVLLDRLGLQPALIEELESHWRYTIQLS